MKGGIYSMEVYERIRFLRKNTLKMSQEVFAERLGCLLYTSLLLQSS